MPSSTTKSLPTPCILVNFSFKETPAPQTSARVATDPVRDRERELECAPRVMAGGDRLVAAAHRVAERGELRLERIAFRVRHAFDRDPGDRPGRGARVDLRQVGRAVLKV